MFLQSFLQCHELAFYEPQNDRFSDGNQQKSIPTMRTYVGVNYGSASIPNRSIKYIYKQTKNSHTQLRNGRNELNEKQVSIQLKLTDPVDVRRFCPFNALS